MKHTLALKILLLFMVSVPVAWVLFDPAGQRWIDVTLLRLLGHPRVSLDYAALRGRETVEELQRTYPDLQLQCAQSGAKGQGCSAQVAAVNGLPARQLLFNFDADGYLYRIQLHYRSAYHELAREQLQRIYGAPSESGASLEKVIQWQAGLGIVLLKDQPVREEEYQLFWLIPRRGQS